MRFRNLIRIVKNNKKLAFEVIELGFILTII